MFKRQLLQEKVDYQDAQYFYDDNEVSHLDLVDAPRKDLNHVCLASKTYRWAIKSTLGFE